MRSSVANCWLNTLNIRVRRITCPQLSVLDRVLDYRAAQSLWSTNNSDRVMAAAFLRLGDQLEVQWQSNDIQRGLPGLGCANERCRVR